MLAATWSTTLRNSVITFEAVTVVPTTIAPPAKEPMLAPAIVVIPSNSPALALTPAQTFCSVFLLFLLGFGPF